MRVTREEREALRAMADEREERRPDLHGVAQHDLLARKHPDPDEPAGSTTRVRPGALLWYKKPPAKNQADHRFHFIGSRWRIDPLDIGVSMGTVPRQESVPNGSMRHRELLKWHC
jgi:hypothetical protein